MRYLSFLAAILESTPVWAQYTYTNTIDVPPGLSARWSAPEPFANVMVGDPRVVSVESDNDQQLTIFAKPNGGTTNIVLLDGNDKQVANILVNAHRYQPARNADTGEFQLYRKDENCYPVCVRLIPQPQRSRADEAH
jgi:Flp pilus assembly secretin CpaC